MPTNALLLFYRGGTRMGGFLTACDDASQVIVPLLDTIIQCKIREEETAYISTVIGLYQLQLFTDLNKLFMDK